jgi:hypothetical protein
MQSNTSPLCTHPSTCQPIVLVVAVLRAMIRIGRARVWGTVVEMFVKVLMLFPQPLATPAGGLSMRGCQVG